MAKERKRINDPFRTVPIRESAARAVGRGSFAEEDKVKLNNGFQNLFQQKMRNGKSEKKRQSCQLSLSP